MGILKPHIEIICREKVKHEDFICGDLLTLGQQAVYATQKEALKILIRNNLKPRELPENFDAKNKRLAHSLLVYATSAGARLEQRYLDCSNKKQRSRTTRNISA